MAERGTYRGNGRTATIADPENITRDECLALARCGAKAWNEWRAAFPGKAVPGHNTASFSGHDFADEPISFDGFQFGTVDFSKARFFHHRQTFFHCVFGNGTSFEKAQFAGSARFMGTSFGSVEFARAEFSRWADFKACSFGGSARFEACVFNDDVAFTGALLTQDARFDQSRFGGGAYFGGTLFGTDVGFACCVFSGNAEFGAKAWSDLRHIYQKPGRSLDAVQSLAEALTLSPIEMGEVDFSGSTFHGSLNFSGRVFRARAAFDMGERPTRSWTEVVDGKETSVTEYVHEPTRFARAPQFFDCRLSQQVTFDSAVFPAPTGNADAARAYRTLKLASCQHQATREEQRFFKLEMQEEAAAESGWKRWLYRAYEVSSDFGFSVWRPLVTLVFLPALVVMLLYLLCMSLQHPKLWVSALAQDSELTSEWLQFTFANMAPLPDGELLKDLRTNLFGSNTYAAVIALKLETLQKVLALAGYFLFGLALRNLFKMK